MTEKELDGLFNDHNVIKAASVKPPTPLVGNGERALGLWLAVQIIQWLKNKHGIQYPKIKKISSFTSEYCEVELFAGSSGKVKEYYAEIEQIAVGEYRLKISLFTPTEGGNGYMDLEWERIGFKIEDSTGGTGSFIETLPTGKRKPGKNSFIRGF